MINKVLTPEEIENLDVVKLLTEFELNVCVAAKTDGQSMSREHGMAVSNIPKLRAQIRIRLNRVREKTV